jgi:hypothetical protein
MPAASLEVDEGAVLMAHTFTIPRLKATRPALTIEQRLLLDRLLAASHVGRYATDAEDLAELLAMIGLDHDAPRYRTGLADPESGLTTKG